MTYSGLKSMIYAGLKPDDPRVKAAIEWIRKNYDVKTNPGLGEAGLYYYCNVFAKSLDALGVDQFEDDAGNKARLAARACRGAFQPAKGGWLLDQQQHEVDGGRSEFGHRIRPAGPFVLPAQ